MEYKRDDLIELLEDKQILDGIYLKKGTLVYVNSIDKDIPIINVSKIDNTCDFWISADNTRLVERGLKC